MRMDFTSTVKLPWAGRVGDQRRNVLEPLPGGFGGELHAIDDSRLVHQQDGILTPHVNTGRESHDPAGKRNAVSFDRGQAVANVDVNLAHASRRHWLRSLCPNARWWLLPVQAEPRMRVDLKRLNLQTTARAT